MIHTVTGGKANMFINGKPVAMANTHYPINAAQIRFDAMWHKRYHQQSQGMIDRLGKTSNAYAHMYNLFEFLWKLEAMKRS